MDGFISGLSILFHWSIYLSLCQYHTIFMTVKSESEVAQSCPTLWDSMDCRLPGSSIHGIFHARVLWGVTISFSRGSSRSRNQTQVSHIVGRWFTIWATREVILMTVQFSSVQSLSCVRLFATPWIAAHQASLSITNSGVHSDSCASSQWCYPASSSSVIPFSSCPQSLPASESFQMSQLLASGGQSTGVSALTSVLPKST